MSSELVETEVVVVVVEDLRSHPEVASCPPGPCMSGPLLGLTLMINLVAMSFGVLLVLVVSTAADTQRRDAH